MSHLGSNSNDRNVDIIGLQQSLDGFIMNSHYWPFQPTLPQLQGICKCYALQPDMKATRTQIMELLKVNNVRLSFCPTFSANDEYNGAIVHYMESSQSNGSDTSNGSTASDRSAGSDGADSSDDSDESSEKSLRFDRFQRSDGSHTDDIEAKLAEICGEPCPYDEVEAKMAEIFGERCPSDENVFVEEEVETTESKWKVN